MIEGGEETRSRRASLAFLLFLGIIAAPMVAGAIRLLPAGYADPAVLRQHVETFGPWAPAAYVLVLAFRPFLFLPSAPLMMAAGLVFGTRFGALLTTAGLVLAALTSYTLARFLGHAFVHRLAGSALERLATMHLTLGVIFTMNLFPIFPLSIPNYGAGIAALPVLPFLMTTGAGLAPRVLAWSAMGNLLADFQLGQLALASGLILVLALLPVIFPSLRPGSRAESTDES